jgi:hypothetical protein
MTWRRNIGYRYYRCRSRAGGKPPCRGDSMPAEQGERFVTDLLSNLSSHAEKRKMKSDLKQWHGFSKFWSQLTDAVRHELIREVVQQVAFDMSAREIQVTLDEQAMQRYGRSCS